MIELLIDRTTEGEPRAGLEKALRLGYEPSVVRSRLVLADFSRSAFDLGIEPKRFLDEFNPMYRKGEEVLARYVTEVPQPAEGHGRILLINNSSSPFDEARNNSLGVLHRAEILAPDERRRRVVNSMMLVAGGPEGLGEEALRSLVATEEISRKLYG